MNTGCDFASPVGHSQQHDKGCRSYRADEVCACGQPLYDGHIELLLEMAEWREAAAASFFNLEDFMSATPNASLTTTPIVDYPLYNNSINLSSNYCWYPYPPWPYYPPTVTIYSPPDPRVAELEGEVKKLQGQVETLMALLTATLAAKTPRRKRGGRTNDG